MKFFYTLFCFLFTLLIFSQTKSLQNSPPLSYGAASSVGMSEERLQRIDLMCKEMIEANKLPGMVALVARNGKIVFHEAYGMADSETEEKLSKDAIFRIASQTKAITSTAVMMLWEEGKFRLNDPIENYIPEFKDLQILDTFNEKDSSYTTKAAKKKITIRQLLTHTSGVGYGFIDSDERFKKIFHKAGIIDGFTTKDITIEENIKKLAKLPLHFEPGEKFLYSEGLDILGYFIEVVSGMPFDEFLRKRLFDPLGMDDTWFYLPASKEDRLAAVHIYRNENWENFEGLDEYHSDFPITGAKSFFSGGAGLSSTAKDYATFLQMFLNQGELNGNRILSRTTVQFMMGNHIGKLWGEDGNAHYGLAFRVYNQKGQDAGGNGSIGTFEWGGYFNTQYFADPKEQIIGILMKQTYGPADDNTGWRIKQLIGQAIDD